MVTFKPPPLYRVYKQVYKYIQRVRAYTREHQKNTGVLTAPQWGDKPRFALDGPRSKLNQCTCKSQSFFGHLWVWLSGRRWRFSFFNHSTREKGLYSLNH